MRYKAAIAAQIALLAYFELCVLIPLGRWNAQPGMDHAFSTGNVILGAMIGGGQLLLLVGTIRHGRLLLWLGLVGDTAWLLMHIQSLWVPYIRGASPEYAEMYARVFGSTTKLLPNFADHLAPDAMASLRCSCRSGCFAEVRMCKTRVTRRVSTNTSVEI